MEGTITQLSLSNYLINEKAKQTSFFNHSYKNHYNFAKDTRKLHFNNTVNLGSTSTIK